MNFDALTFTNVQITYIIIHFTAAALLTTQNKLMYNNRWNIY